MASILSFAAGALAWNAAEYAIHRFIGHGPKRTRARSIASKLTPSGLAAEFNAEHLAHHADPMYFAPTSHKLVVAAVSTAVVGGLGSMIVGPRRAMSFAVGLTSSYLTYENIHRRIHTHGPTGRYGRWVRRHHLHHHHRSPRHNHGVVTPMWDHVWRTIQPVERLRIPRRFAPTWMLDASGEVKTELRDDFEVFGPATGPRPVARAEPQAAGSEAQASGSEPQASGRAFVDGAVLGA